MCGMPKREKSSDNGIILKKKFDMKIYIDEIPGSRELSQELMSHSL